MWEAAVKCDQCDEVHRVYSSSPAIPRGFAFECPDTGERVTIAFRNPAVMSQPWSEVTSPSPGALDTLVEEERSAFE